MASLVERIDVVLQVGMLPGIVWHDSQRHFGHSRRKGPGDLRSLIAKASIVVADGKQHGLLLHGQVSESYRIFHPFNYCFILADGSFHVLIKALGIQKVGFFLGEAQGRFSRTQLFGCQAAF